MNSVNYDDYVMKVSQIKRDANLTVGVATVTLNNALGTFNFLHQTNTAMGISASIQVYVSGAAADLHPVFAGKVENVRYVGSRAIVRIKDHIADLIVKRIASGREYFAMSNRTADNMVYNILVSFGAIDSTQGSGNTDIDWTSFTNWRDNYLSGKNYKLSCKFTSQDIRWGLLKIAQLTHSYVYINGSGKIAFAPPYTTGFAYDETNSKPRNLEVDMSDMINKILIRSGYVWSDDFWNEDTGYVWTQASINQYGEYTYDEESRVVWHHGPTSAGDDVTQSLTDFAYPIRTFDITTHIGGMTEEIANQITVSDTVKSISNETAIVEEMIIDLDARNVKLKGWWTW